MAAEARQLEAIAALPQTGRARLRPPANAVRALLAAHRRLSRLQRSELTPAAQWLLDNMRMLCECAQTLSRELAHAPRVPASGGVPRVLLFCRALCEGAREPITRGGLLAAAESWQGVRAFELDELSLMYCALRVALLERVLSLSASAVEETAIAERAAMLARRYLQGDTSARLPDEPLLVERLLRALSESENPEALKYVDAALRALDVDRDRAASEAHARLMRTRADIGGAIVALRASARLPWQSLSEEINRVHAILRADPVFSRMDMESRALYARRVARIARRVKMPEEAVARAALACAREGEGERAEAGYYLLTDGSDLRRRLGARSRLCETLRAHGQTLYCWALYAADAVLLALAIVLGIPWYACLPAVCCAASMMHRALAATLSRRVPPRTLPRVRVTALPQDARTLVCVPTLLTGENQALTMAARLSVHFCGNDAQGVDFMLLCDFADSQLPAQVGDEEIVRACASAVRALNAEYGERFYYLHRRRAWCESERAYMGRERKRGALEMLGRLIAGEEPGDVLQYASVPPESLAGKYAYIVTLDADTFLPPGSALRLVGTMLHPLNARYAIVQPRMAVSADRVNTWAQRLLGGAGGVDLYGSAAGDVYQDLFGRGSYVGKGIYRPGALLSATDARVPTGCILSHDLLEGELAGSALAGDIVLYDGNPGHVAGFLKRLHRWTRGDWQLLPYLLDRRLPLLSRHKMLDNLRRSLTPLAQAILLATAVATGSWWLLLLSLAPCLRLRDLPASFSSVLLLPATLATQLDAAARAVFRQFVSKRGLLSWVTAAQAEESGGAPPLYCTLSSVALGVLLGALAFVPSALRGAGIALFALYALAPLAWRLMNAPIERDKKLGEPDRQLLLSLARDTWRFFERTVTKETHHLPPDNLQIDPDRGIAPRTSPTNIGLYLLSCAAACELGILDADEAARRIAATLDTLERLSVWKGHLYNWYDTRTLAPLEPAFVSSVDSGNLAACLMACAQLLRARAAQVDLAVRDVPARLDALLVRMDLGALYVQKDRLFSVGYDVRADALSGARYDLLASEARLLSFMAIARGQAPVKHWFALGRNQTRACGGQTLLSWGGTMFEYLLPALLMPMPRGTLLRGACAVAVRAQRLYARAGRPWGVSESGYALLDPQLDYQYRAFGVPALSLSRETEGRVVAPYAAALALPVAPRRAARNLRRMKALGWTDDMGFFEAVDYQNVRAGKPPRLVYSHMAHHQGMILCSVCNALCGDRLVRAFTALPRVRAHSLLWQEPKLRRSARLPLPRAARAEEHPPQTLQRTARQGFPVDAHALYGAGTTLLLGAQGQGYIAHRGVMLSRFTPEAGAQTGLQCYVRDGDTGAFFRPTDGGACVFTLESARYDALACGLRAELCCFVAPLTGAAVYLLKITDMDRRARRVEIASFMEVALGGLSEDRAHPAFRNLFVRVEERARGVLAAYRRPDKQSAEARELVHFLRADTAPEAIFTEGDRMAFIGRAGDVKAPQALRSEARPGTLGAVIEPCVSLRARFSLPPGGQVTACFITALVDPGDTAESVLRAFPEASSASAGVALALTRAQMAARYLGLDAAALSLAQRMTGCVLFCGQPHQARGAAGGRQTLWRLGISGDLPILTVALQARGELTVARQAAAAHAWWRLSGVWVDLAIVCPEEIGYERPLHDGVAALLSGIPAGAPGGAHLIGGADEEAIAALRACSRLFLTGEAIKKQLDALQGGALGTPREDAIGDADDAPSGEGLREWNGYGGFDEDGSYVVRLAKGRAAPAPWCNVLCGARFGTLCAEQGVLYSYYNNSRLGRLTAACQDAVVVLPTEGFFLRDGDELYSLTPRPFSSCAYEIVHAPGATVYRASPPGLACEVVVSAAPDGTAGERAVQIHALKEPKMLALLYAVRFAMGEAPLCTSARAEGDTLIASDPGMPGVAFARLPDADAFALSPGEYWGLRGARVPVALARAELPAGGGSVGVLKQTVRLEAGERVTLRACLGWAESADALPRRVPGADDARAYWASRLSRLRVSSPSESLDRALNVWLPYQTRASRLLARAGFYQPGGAIGFRDQLQDMLSLLYTEPGRVREHLLSCARHQFVEGDVQHWWHEPRLGVRTAISDDLLFLPYLTAKYARISGDTGVLETSVPYLSAPELAEGEHDRYFSPDESDLAEPLREHCLRAIRRVRYGARGLPLMGGGDWNDGMNAVGGESVWLCFFLICVLREFEPLCGERDAEELRALRERLLAASQSAWTGKWYLRAWYLSGEALGGPDTDPPRIDLISQCWAVMAGVPAAQARAALDAAWETLYDAERGMLKLLSPPFEPEEGAGYIAGYLPGVRENGGQYTHAVPWMIRALLLAGMRDRAFELIAAALPSAHGDTPEKIARYRVEPYVLAADIYAAPGQEGRGGWTWYTGSAAWLYYVLLTDVLGFEKRGDRARVSPKIPDDWRAFTLTYRFGASEYRITASRDARTDTLDGRPLEDGFLPLADDGRAHEAMFTIRNS